MNFPVRSSRNRNWPALSLLLHLIKEAFLAYNWRALNLYRPITIQKAERTVLS